MWFIHNPLRHLEAIRHWANETGAQVQLSPSTWALTVSLGAASCLLQPRFVVNRKGGLAYTSRFEDLATFIGWCPIGAPSWPLAQDKLAFKQSLRRAGVRVPAVWTCGQALHGDFIIKPRGGSFGRGIQGPFKAQGADVAGALPQDMYFEQFIDGRAAKAWCWSGQVAVLEVMERPYLLGDGKRSVSELAAARGSMDQPLRLESAKDMLAWQGMQEDAVVPRAKKVWLDFRYATPYDRPVPWDGDVWDKTSVRVQHQFLQAVALLSAAVPQAQRDQALFTVDAVIDQDDQVWFLEMNSHPMMHPGLYHWVLRGILGARAAHAEEWGVAREAEVSRDITAYVRSQLT